MSQRVRTDIVHPRANPNVLLNHPANRARRDSRSLIIQKQRFFITLQNWRVHEKLVAHVEITSDRRTRRISKRYDPLLPSFPRYTHELISEINVRDIERR